MAQTVSAKATCQYCDWSARFKGDTVIEVATFLRRLCIEHCEEMHADELDARGVAAPRIRQRTEDA